MQLASDGIISISGPSTMSRYLTSEGFTESPASIETRDVGVVADGQLFVRGRHDDLLIVAGRKFFAHDIEAVVEQLAGVHDGGCVAVGSETIDIIVECAGNEASPAQLERTIRLEASRQFGVPIGRVAAVPRYGLLKTPSGKKRRRDSALEHLSE